MSSPSAPLEKRAMHGTHDADGVDSSFSSYDSLSSLVQAPLPVRELSGGAPTSTALPFRSNPNPTTRQWSDDLPTAVRRRAFVRRALELPTVRTVPPDARPSGARPRPLHVNVALAHERGEEVARPCCYCRRALGPNPGSRVPQFRQCVALEGFSFGGCTNCDFTNRNCSLRGRSKKREAKDDDGGIDDDDDVLELPPTRQKVLETKLQYLEGGLLSTLEELRSMCRTIETET